MRPKSSSRHSAAGQKARSERHRIMEELIDLGNVNPNRVTQGIIRCKNNINTL